MIHIEFDLDYTGHRQVNADGDYAPSETVEEAIIRCAGEAAWNAVSNKSDNWSKAVKVSEIRAELIRERLIPIVEEAISQSIQQTDNFGSPRGEPITIAEYVTKLTTEYLTKETDYRTKETVVKKLIREQVERTVNDQLIAAMKDAQKEVMDAVKAQGAEVLAKTIAKMAGV